MFGTDKEIELQDKIILTEKKSSVENVNTTNDPILRPELLIEEVPDNLLSNGSNDSQNGSQQDLLGSRGSVESIQSIDSQEGDKKTPSDDEVVINFGKKQDLPDFATDIEALLNTDLTKLGIPKDIFKTAIWREIWGFKNIDSIEEKTKEIRDDYAIDVSNAKIYHAKPTVNVVDQKVTLKEFENFKKLFENIINIEDSSTPIPLKEKFNKEQLKALKAALGSPTDKLIDQHEVFFLKNASDFDKVKDLEHYDNTCFITQDPPGCFFLEPDSTLEEKTIKSHHWCDLYRMSELPQKNLKNYSNSYILVEHDSYVMNLKDENQDINKEIDTWLQGENSPKMAHLYLVKNNELHFVSIKDRKIDSIEKIEEGTKPALELLEKQYKFSSSKTATTIKKLKQTEITSLYSKTKHSLAANVPAELIYITPEGTPETLNIKDEKNLSELLKQVVQKPSDQFEPLKKDSSEAENKLIAKLWETITDNPGYSNLDHFKKLLKKEKLDQINEPTLLSEALSAQSTLFEKVSNYFSPNDNHNFDTLRQFWDLIADNEDRDYNTFKDLTDAAKGNRNALNSFLKKTGKIFSLSNLEGLPPKLLNSLIPILNCEKPYLSESNTNKYSTATQFWAAKIITLVLKAAIRGPKRYFPILFNVTNAMNIAVYIANLFRGAIPYDTLNLISVLFGFSTQVYSNPIIAPLVCALPPLGMIAMKLFGSVKAALGIDAEICDSFLMYTSEQSDKKTTIESFLKKNLQRANLYIVDGEKLYCVYIKKGKVTKEEAIKEKGKSKTGIQEAIKNLKNKYSVDSSSPFKLNAADIENITANTHHVPPETLINILNNILKADPKLIDKLSYWPFHSMGQLLDYLEFELSFNGELTAQQHLIYGLFAMRLATDPNTPHVTRVKLVEMMAAVTGAISWDDATINATPEMTEAIRAIKVAFEFITAYFAKYGNLVDVGLPTKIVSNNSNCVNARFFNMALALFGPVALFQGWTYYSFAMTPVNLGRGIDAAVKESALDADCIKNFGTRDPIQQKGNEKICSYEPKKNVNVLQTFKSPEASFQAFLQSPFTTQQLLDALNSIPQGKNLDNVDVDLTNWIQPTDEASRFGNMTIILKALKVRVNSINTLYFGKTVNGLGVAGVPSLKNLGNYTDFVQAAVDLGNITSSFDFTQTGLSGSDGYSIAKIINSGYNQSNPAPRTVSINRNPSLSTDSFQAILNATVDGNYTSLSANNNNYNDKYFIGDPLNNATRNVASKLLQIPQLDLSFNNIQSGTTSVVATAVQTSTPSNNFKLKSLNLNRNAALGDKGVNDVATIMKPLKLTQVQLTGTGFGDPALKNISQALNNNQDINQLVISSNTNLFKDTNTTKLFASGLANSSVKSLNMGNLPNLANALPIVAPAFKNLTTLLMQQIPNLNETLLNLIPFDNLLVLQAPGCGFGDRGAKVLLNNAKKVNKLQVIGLGINNLVNISTLTPPNSIQEYLLNGNNYPQSELDGLLGDMQKNASRYPNATTLGIGSNLQLKRDLNISLGATLNKLAGTSFSNLQIDSLTFNDTDMKDFNFQNTNLSTINWNNNPAIGSTGFKEFLRKCYVNVTYPFDIWPWLNPSAVHPSTYQGIVNSSKLTNVNFDNTGINTKDAFDLANIALPIGFSANNVSLAKNNIDSNCFNINNLAFNPQNNASCLNYIGNTSLTSSGFSTKYPPGLLTPYLATAYGIVKAKDFAERKLKNDFNQLSNGLIGGLLFFSLLRAGYNAILGPYLKPDPDANATMISSKKAREALMKAASDHKELIRKFLIVVEQHFSISFKNRSDHLACCNEIMTYLNEISSKRKTSAELTLDAMAEDIFVNFPETLKKLNDTVQRSEGYRLELTNNPPPAEKMQLDVIYLSFDGISLYFTVKTINKIIKQEIKRENFSSSNHHLFVEMIKNPKEGEKLNPKQEEIIFDVLQRYDSEYRAAKNIPLSKIETLVADLANENKTLFEFSADQQLPDFSSEFYRIAHHKGNTDSTFDKEEAIRQLWEKVNAYNTLPESDTIINEELKNTFLLLQNALSLQHHAIWTEQHSPEDKEDKEYLERLIYKHDIKFLAADIENKLKHLNAQSANATDQKSNLSDTYYKILSAVEKQLEHYSQLISTLKTPSESTKYNNWLMRQCGHVEEILSLLQTSTTENLKRINTKKSKFKEYVRELEDLQKKLLTLPNQNASMANSADDNMKIMRSKISFLHDLVNEKSSFINTLYSLDKTLSAKVRLNDKLAPFFKKDSRYGMTSLEMMIEKLDHHESHVNTDWLSTRCESVDQSLQLLLEAIKFVENNKKNTFAKHKKDLNEIKNRILTAANGERISSINSFNTNVNIAQERIKCFRRIIEDHPHIIRLLKKTDKKIDETLKSDPKLKLYFERDSKENSLKSLDALVEKLHHYNFYTSYEEQYLKNLPTLDECTNELESLTTLQQFNAIKQETYLLFKQLNNFAEQNKLINKEFQDQLEHLLAKIEKTSKNINDRNLRITLNEFQHQLKAIPMDKISVEKNTKANLEHKTLADNFVKTVERRFSISFKDKSNLSTCYADILAYLNGIPSQVKQAEERLLEEMAIDILKNIPESCKKQSEVLQPAEGYRLKFTDKPPVDMLSDIIYLSSDGDSLYFAVKTKDKIIKQDIRRTDFSSFYYHRWVKMCIQPQQSETLSSEDKEVIFDVLQRYGSEYTSQKELSFKQTDDIMTDINNSKKMFVELSVNTQLSDFAYAFHQIARHQESLVNIGSKLATAEELLQEMHLIESYTQLIKNIETYYSIVQKDISEEAKQTLTVLKNAIVLQQSAILIEDYNKSENVEEKQYLAHTVYKHDLKYLHTDIEEQLKNLTIQYKYAIEKKSALSEIYNRKIAKIENKIAHCNNLVTYLKKQSELTKCPLSEKSNNYKFYTHYENQYLNNIPDIEQCTGMLQKMSDLKECITLKQEINKLFQQHAKFIKAKSPFTKEFKEGLDKIFIKIESAITKIKDKDLQDTLTQLKRELKIISEDKFSVAKNTNSVFSTKKDYEQEVPLVPLESFTF